MAGVIPSMRALLQLRAGPETPLSLQQFGATFGGPSKKTSFSSF